MIFPSAISISSCWFSYLVPSHHASLALSGQQHPLSWEVFSCARCTEEHPVSVSGIKDGLQPFVHSWSCDQTGTEGSCFICGWWWNTQNNNHKNGHNLRILTPTTPAPRFPLMSLLLHGQPAENNACSTPKRPHCWEGGKPGASEFQHTHRLVHTYGQSAQWGCLPFCF